MRMSKTLQVIDDFSGADLGDARRSKRLAAIVAQATATPAGTITGTFKDEAAREGAYRFLGNEAVDCEAVRSAGAYAGFARALGLSYVFVPCDASTLTLPSVPDESEMGPVGNTWSRELGVQVMSGIIVGPDGVTLGTAGQKYWARERQPRRSRTKTYLSSKTENRSKRSTHRPISEKETLHWGTVMDQAIASSQEAGFVGQLWFQLDAGADFAHLLASATLLSPWLTVRTKNPRALFDEAGLLADKVLRAAPVGTMVVSVPGNSNRIPREATLELRYAPVVLKLEPRGDEGTIPAPLFAVHAREISPVPADSEAIDWLLLTNKPGATLEDAKLVVFGYSTRWRIEEVHKTWKSVAKVEESGLQSLHGFTLWAIILFSTAIRIERLKYFARVQPEAPATTELEPHEVHALRVLRGSKASRAQTPLTIALAVRWIADLGGYMNPKKGPPGSITIARGLNYLRLFARGLREGDKK
jgi:Transposase DNA-binding